MTCFSDFLYLHAISCYTSMYVLHYSFWYHIVSICLFIFFMVFYFYDSSSIFFFFFSRVRRHTSCTLVTGVQTCALPIYQLDLASADASSEVWTVLAITPLWLVTLAQHRLYVARYVTRPLEEVRRVVSAALWTVVGASAAVFFAFPGADVPRRLLGLFVVAGIGTLLAGRFAVRTAYDRARAEGRMLRPVVIVGANDEGRALANMLSHQPRLGYDVRGFVDDDADGTMVDGIQVCGSIDKTAEVVEQPGSSALCVAAPALDLAPSQRQPPELTEPAT